MTHTNMTAYYRGSKGTRVKKIFFERFSCEKVPGAHKKISGVHQKLSGVHVNVPGMHKKVSSVHVVY